MNPGRLNRRITIQELSTAIVRDAYGAVVPTWEDTDEIWAARRPLSASEQVQSGQVYSEGTVLFTMRYRALKPTARISYGKQIYNIKSIVDVGDRQTELQILTSVEAT